MLTASFLRYIESQLNVKQKQKLHIRRVKPISGGSINLCARIDTTSGVYFLKSNDSYKYPLMFEKEVHGLNVLRETKTISIPEVIMTGEEEGQAFLIMQFVEGSMRSPDFWKSFGTSLAKLHQTSSQRFGYQEDNYIGSLFQSNRQHNKWADFFTEERLEQQLKLAIVSGKMKNSDEVLFKKLYTLLDTIIPIENPSLLHGDLWNGNFITGSKGEPYLVDPAVYYGHREIDLAMTKLFGGFDDEFYQSYQETFPLSPGFEDRIHIHNLYPLMVHVNLFGGGYADQVRGILKKYA